MIAGCSWDESRGINLVTGLPGTCMYNIIDIYYNSIYTITYIIYAYAYALILVYI